MLPSYFVVIGTLISFLGTVSYLIDTVKGKVKPNRVSFFLWTLAPLIAFAAELKQGVGIQSFMTFSVGFLPLLVLIASFFNKKAKWKLNAFDITCGIFSLIGLVLWFLTRVGNIAIAFSIIADGLAAIPTIVKAYKYPDTESIWAWLTSAISAMFTLLTIRQWSFAQFGFPAYIFVANSLIYFFVQSKIGKKRRSK